MTLEEFIKENRFESHRPLLEKCWQAAHSEGEKVGWEDGMRNAARIATGDLRQSVAELILKAIDARKDK